MKYRKTELGKQTFKERNSTLTLSQKSAFILFDGEKEDTFVFKALAATGISAGDINFLVESGLIEPCEPQQRQTLQHLPVQSLTDLTKTAASNSDIQPSEQHRYQNAYPIATKLTSGLGLRGFRLNLAVESAGSYQDLVALAPKIRDAVGDTKFIELARALQP